MSVAFEAIRRSVIHSRVTMILKDRARLHSSRRPKRPVGGCRTQHLRYKSLTLRRQRNGCQRFACTEALQRLAKTHIVLLPQVPTGRRLRPRPAKRLSPGASFCVAKAVWRSADTLIAMPIRHRSSSGQTVQQAALATRRRVAIQIP